MKKIYEPVSFGHPCLVVDPVDVVADADQHVGLVAAERQAVRRRVETNHANQRVHLVPDLDRAVMTAARQHSQLGAA